MPVPLDSTAITHGIQLAVAPVFLLTAVAGMIGAVAGRLARIIDRARVVEDRARASNDAELIQRTYAELATLRTRGRMANVCIGLLTLCGVQAVLFTVEGDIAGLGNNQVAVLTLHLHRLWAQNYIVTRGDAALVICMCGHRRER